MRRTTGAPPISSRFCRRPSRKFSARLNRESRGYRDHHHQKRKKPRLLGARLLCSGDRLNLTEPLRSFCPSFSLAEGLVVIASHRRLVPIFGAPPFCDTGLDIDTARPFECRHDFSTPLEVHAGNLGRHRLPAVLTITIFTIIDKNVMPVTGSMWAMRFSGIRKPGHMSFPHGSSHPGVHVPPADEAGGIVMRTTTRPSAVGD